MLYAYIYGTKYTHTGRPDEVRRFRAKDLQDTHFNQNNSSILDTITNEKCFSCREPRLRDGRD